ncbi:hypothetical protein EDD86DRAFT_195775, partial [Gorgonomyces haynaldii]
TKVPFPAVLTRHLIRPQTLGNVAGFRIEVNGRRGSRGARSIVSYGKFNMGNVGGITGSKVDFAKSVYVTKRGAYGVKVTVAYQ